MYIVPNSYHEAYAVILEELEEFKAIVFQQAGARVSEDARKELVQCAAMCLRSVLDLNLDLT